MAWIVQLFVPRRRKNRSELAERAAEVIRHVLFDVGVDRFLNGTLLVDRRYRVRFFSGNEPGGGALAAVPVAALPRARALGANAAQLPLLAGLPQAVLALLVEELMAALLAQSALLRALPERRYRIAERRAAASK
ncbi:hypothetical protein ACSUZJ_16160 [Telluria sp. B2]